MNGHVEIADAPVLEQRDETPQQVVFNMPMTQIVQPKEEVLIVE